MGGLPDSSPRCESDDCVEVEVFKVAPQHGRRLLILAAVAAIAVSACGSSATPSPSATPGSAATDTSQPSPSSQASSLITSLDNAGTALSNLSSYKFTMTVVGGDLSDNTLTTLPNAPANGVFKVSGTYIFQPAESADITIADVLHEISIGGSDYQDVAPAGAKLTGSFTQSDSSSGTSLIDPLSPTSIYTSFDFSGSFTTVGPEQKDGIDTTHFSAGDSALAEFASVSGEQAGSWTANVWLANDGGYPISMSIVGTTSATDKTVVYERTFDLTNVNSTTNSVTAPTNISGA
jgi:hypothetical protein